MMTFFDKPLHFSGIIKQAFRFSCQTFKQNVLLIILLGGFSAVFSSMHTANVHLDDQLNKSSILLSMLAMCMSTALFSCIICHVHRVFRDPQASIGISCSIVLKKLFTIFGSMLLVLTAVFFGSLLVLPGLFLMILFLFYLPAILLDQKSVFGALSESARLVWGYWWQTFWVIFLPLLGSLLAFAIILPFFPSQSAVILGVVRFVVIGLMGFLMVNIVLVQFFNLKLQHTLDRESKTAESNVQ